MSFHCYYEYSFSSAPEEHSGMGPCGQPGDGNLQCCAIGEKCMSNGICAYSGVDGGGSGYYIGGCTDKTMKNPNCPTNCTSFPNSDVVYDYNIGQWRCCGNDAYGNRNCSFPQGSPLLSGALAPIDLLYIATVVGTGSSLPLASKVAVLSSTSSGATSATVTTRTTVTVTVTPAGYASSGGLSAGAAAGVTIGAVLGTLALVAIGICLFWRRKGYQMVRHESPTPVSSQNYALNNPTTPYVEHYAPAKQDLPMVSRPEMGTESRAELGDNPHRYARELGG